MPVETFAYINSLNPSNPPGSDGLAQGDDHIRGLKTVLTNSFTGISGATNVTQTTLNSLEANTHEFFVPRGAIVDFLDRVPTGWLECNGQAVSRTTYAGLFALYGTTYGVGDGSTTFNVPSMADRYRRQRGTYAVNATPAGLVGTHGHTATGATTVTVASDGSHSHTGATGGQSVNHTHSGTTGSENTDHTHTVTDPGHLHAGGDLFDAASVGTVNAPVGGAAVVVTAANNSGAGNTASATTGISLSGTTTNHQHAFASGTESTTHTHSIPSDGAHSHAGSTAATTVTVANSTTQENMPNSFVVITCVKY